MTYPDGTTEEVTVPVTVGEQPENTKYSPSTKPVEKPFGEAPSEEEVTSKVTVPGYPTDAAKQPTFKVTDPSTLPDGKTAGKTDVSVTVTYPDGTTEEVTVPVTVGEQPENTKYSPSTKPVEKPFGEAPSEEEVTSKVTVPGYPTDAAKQPTF
ncbi:Rib/alpha-like domain-containing protein [Staphylococcus aureus]|nr:Rib/alpha-like domain-containing protein [Staphylococcus aureus]QTY43545.1 hypothetical protein JYA46_002800 [Staphylococcus aureus]